MTAEQLDELLMDHALGETHGDVAELIDTCAEKDPAIRLKLTHWQTVAGTARGALGQTALPQPASLPPFPRASLPLAAKNQRWQPLLLGASGMAACVCLGFLLGARTASAPAPAVASATPAVGVPAAPPEIAAVSNFWSVSRFRAIAENAQKPAKVQPWTAILRRPGFAIPSGD
jgi:hypothetical protein